MIVTDGLHAEPHMGLEAVSPELLGEAVLPGAVAVDQTSVREPVSEELPEACSSPALAPLPASRLRRIAGALLLGVTAFVPEAKTLAEQQHPEHAAARNSDVLLDARAEVGVAARAMHERGFAYDMPSFAEQCADASRQTPFRATDGREMIEHAGLVELEQYLEASTSPLARELLEGLNFMGKQEFDTATELLALYWKSLLARNPSEQLCLWT